ncbi:Type II secretion system (T2SS), protein M subtype b [Tepidimonas thermarum]|uniref:Type II secretion system (T2SS), protein M subtype b n=1 Tax=Tepidimonas thermarum TaxID=335431 RepID=A0A554WYV9_9BURK|nr:type II secretion system protein GspM [Tepidimonas thermarum]TSE28761.1 Type II secretion system (T2SS), protein M subtype b [Tepidimonas thermarum]
MNPWTRRALAVPAVLLLAIAAAVAGAATWLLQRYQTGLQILEPRIERLAGLVEAGGDIQAQLEQATQQVGPWLHPSSPNVSTEVQQRLRALIDGAGLTSVALQAAEPDASGTLKRVRISATVTGPWPNAVRFLQNLQQQRPVLWVQSMGVMREGRDAPTEPQTVRLTLQIDAPVAPEAAP